MNLNKSLDLIRELNLNNVDYIIVGGIALLLHGVVRATEDIDNTVRLQDKADVEALRDLFGDEVS